MKKKNRWFSVASNQASIPQIEPQNASNKYKMYPGGGGGGDGGGGGGYKYMVTRPHLSFTILQSNSQHQKQTCSSVGDAVKILRGKIARVDIKNGDMTVMQILPTVEEIKFIRALD